MKGLLAFTILGLSAVLSSAALAQDVEGQSSRLRAVSDAEEVQGVASSFGELAPVLNVGQDIIVREEANRATRGRVVSVSGDQLVITRRGRWFPRRQERAFTEDAVRRIEVVDSGWTPGGLIGMAVGAPVLAWSIWKMAEDGGNLSPLHVMFFGAPAIVLGTGVGGWVDSRINRPIYERPSPSSRIAVAPWLGQDQKGVMARVRF